MDKRIGIAVIIIVMILTAGCQTGLTSTTEAASAALSEAQAATFSVLSTQVNKPTDGILRFGTSTPTATTETGGEEVTTNNSNPSGNITITSITPKSYGTAMINWQAEGDFPHGFKVVWSDQMERPTYPENLSVSAGSSLARSAVINIGYNKIYYVRVCRLNGAECDIYSDLGIFYLPTPTATPKPTRTPYSSSSSSSSGSGTYDSTLVITLMKGGDSGKAYMEWLDKLGSSNGYRIVYSTSSSTPVYGTNSSFLISDSAARSAYVDGSSSTTYYYRICRYTSSGCSSYSATYSFTFPSTYTSTPTTTATITTTTTTTPTATATSDSSSITLDTVVDNDNSGNVYLEWTASGTFNNGFRILYSTSESTPTYENASMASASSSSSSATLGLSNNTHYYLRICKYTGSGCSTYSNTEEFTTASSDIVLSQDGTDETLFTWTISADNADGYRLFWQDGSITPIWPVGNNVQVTDGSVKTANTGTFSDDGYYVVRLCTWNNTSGTCSAYSNTVRFNHRTP